MSPPAGFDRVRPTAIVSTIFAAAPRGEIERHLVPGVVRFCPPGGAAKPGRCRLGAGGNHGPGKRRRNACLPAVAGEGRVSAAVRRTEATTWRAAGCAPDGWVAETLVGFADRLPRFRRTEPLLAHASHAGGHGPDVRRARERPPRGEHAGRFRADLVAGDRRVRARRPLRGAGGHSGTLAG